MSLIKLATNNKKTESQPHQVAAVKQLKKAHSEIAYHGLGSGKTKTAIDAGEELAKNESKLVITPAALQHNFKKELIKFNVPDKDYHFVSYETFRRNPQRYIDKYKPKMIISDEFHRTKDPGTLTGDAIRDTRKQVKYFLGLTGSVAQNHPSEIAELLHTATGYPVLGDEKQFRSQFIHNKVVKPGLMGRLMGRKPGVIEEAKNLDKFKDIAKRYINTFSGDAEYMRHIPTVTEEIKHVSMNDEQQKIYNYTFGKVPGWLKYKIKHNLPPSKQESANLNAFLIGARQVSTSTGSFGGHSSTPKIDAIIHDIQHGIKTDKNFKGVVYSNFLESGLDPLASKLKKLNVPYGLFTGEQKPDERNRMVQEYNKGKLKALLISPAGGEGLDLKGTKFMAVTEPNWNPQRTQQAIGRAARFKSHEHLPENERNVRVVQYLSEPKLGLIDKVKRFYNPNVRKIGVDEYIYNRSMDKDKLNRQFTDALK